MSSTTISEIPVLGAAGGGEMAKALRVFSVSGIQMQQLRWEQMSLHTDHTCINAAVWSEAPGQSPWQHPMPVPNNLSASSEGAAEGSGQENPPAQGCSACC